MPELPASPVVAGTAPTDLRQLLDDLARAHGAPPADARVRSTPEDFQVDELMEVRPCGEGEHVWLRLRKRGINTGAVAQQLAALAGVKHVDVGFAGLKDRHAVTTQWFSVRLPGLADPDWSALNDEALHVLEARRHDRKLRRGAHSGNRFRLHLRELRGERTLIEERLARIAAQGVPNYFGEQRFGASASNLVAARALFEGTRRARSSQRGLWLSAARSLLFNVVLSQRVSAQTWNRPVAGDAMMLSGSHSYFIAEVIDEELTRRIAARDVVPSGPLWGRGELPTRHEAHALESDALVAYETWLRGLERFGLKQQRRALVLFPGEFKWEFCGEDSLLLSFTLEPGAFATAVLRELVVSQ
ncbi:MAG: tRNA pseudouridine(13) synthase TruD [Pseudomonadota bacterium]|nr:MAG: tRNA pseudouridine(13) synthase TruD [Pseudomonadota bacterium]